MVPLFDLKLQYQSIRSDIQAALEPVFEGAHYILGPAVETFETEFAAYCQVAHAIGVNNGTNAIQLALLAEDIGPGDEVITTPHTFLATVAAIRYTGATPVLVDVEPHSLTIDPDQIERAITPRTRAIIAVHLYGQAANLNRILDISRQHGLQVIEDCAQAHGATYCGKTVGSIGDYGCFSFYPSKNLGACGEGGMVTTSDDSKARKLRMLRDWGAATKNHHVLKGFNMRLEGVQGAVLSVKLRRLTEWTEQRRAHAQAYDAMLRPLGLDIVKERPENRHVYHLYVVRSQDRDGLQKHLNAAGIQTGVHYPVSVHLQPAHADLHYRKGDFPVAEDAARTVLSLPMFPELTEEQRVQVVTAAESYVLAGSVR